MDLGFFPRTDATIENAEQLEVTVTREGKSLGSNVTLRLVFLPPPTPITDDDARPGKNTII